MTPHAHADRLAQMADMNERIALAEGDHELTAALRAGAAALRQQTPPEGWQKVARERRRGIKAILAAVRGDEKGECWTIRRWLDEHGVFNDDLQGPNRLVEEACKVLLLEAAPPAAQHAPTIAERETGQ